MHLLSPSSLQRELLTKFGSDRIGALLNAFGMFRRGDYRRLPINSF
jgi:hypothetical protein